MRTSEVQTLFPGLVTFSQAAVIASNSKEFFGFDAIEQPVMNDAAGNFYSLDDKGEHAVATPPYHRAYLQPGIVEMTVVASVDFTVTAEFASEEELLAALEMNADIRNKIVRKMENLIRIVTMWEDTTVGYIDEDRAITIGELKGVTVRGIAKK